MAMDAFMAYSGCFEARCRALNRGVDRRAIGERKAACSGHKRGSPWGEWQTRSTRTQGGARQEEVLKRAEGSVFTALAAIERVCVAVEMGWQCWTRFSGLGPVDGAVGRIGDSFGSQAVSSRPLALRPNLTVGLPFRDVVCHDRRDRPLQAPGGAALARLAAVPAVWSVLDGLKRTMVHAALDTAGSLDTVVGAGHLRWLAQAGEVACASDKGQ